MINKETILILGAGASKPYEMPLGKELIDILKGSKIVNEKYLEVLSALEIQMKHYDELNKRTSYHTSFKKMQDKLLTWPRTETLDSFLSIYEKQYLEIGKASIAYIFYFLSKRTSVFDIVDDQNWYDTLWQYLKCDNFEAFISQPIKIYTFNYDLTLDFYLLCSIKHKYFPNENDYSIIEDKCQSIMPKHIYGSIDKVSSSYYFEKFLIEIKDIQDISVFFEKAKTSIHLIGETSTNEMFNQINLMALNNHRVFFLGFGFDENNLKNFELEKWRRDKVYIEGTAMGTTKTEQQWIHRKVYKDAPPAHNTLFYDQDCKTFLRNTGYLAMD